MRLFDFVCTVGLGFAIACSSKTALIRLAARPAALHSLVVMLERLVLLATPARSAAPTARRAPWTYSDGGFETHRFQRDAITFEPGKMVLTLSEESQPSSCSFSNTGLVPERARKSGELRPFNCGS
jgi:hypothetical protein